jgi:hypothetical protein
MRTMPADERPWRLNRLAAIILLAAAALAGSPGCSAPAGSDGGARIGEPGNQLIRSSRVRLTVLMVAIDETKAEGDIAYTRLQEYAGVISTSEGRRQAESWAEIERHIRTLRASNAVAFIAQPHWRIRSGARSTIEMSGASNVRMTISIRAVERPTGGVTVDVGAAFTGDERENRFEDFTFRGGRYEFADERLLVNAGLIEGSDMPLGLGQAITPQHTRVLVFVSAEPEG